MRLSWYTTAENWKLAGEEWKDKILCIECFLEILDLNANVISICNETWTRQLPLRQFKANEFRLFFNGLASTSERMGGLP